MPARSKSPHGGLRQRQSAPLKAKAAAGDNSDSDDRSALLENLQREWNEFRLTDGEFMERNRQGMVMVGFALVLCYFAWQNESADGMREGALVRSGFGIPSPTARPTVELRLAAC